MKSVLLMSVAPALLASTLFVSTPAAAAGADERAVSQCQTALASRFEPGAIRSTRVGEIAGNSRRTRVTIYVNADRRYTFECAAGSNGQLQSAALTPPMQTRLAGAGAANQAQR